MASTVGEVRDPLSINVVEAAGNDASRIAVSYEDIANKLLNEKFLLTALELHAELCEAGQELPVLREFFSNVANFETHNVKLEPYLSMARSSSQATLDSLDMTRFSEDGGVDERVAILEFELRKARENISALRANLTVVTESENTAPDQSTEKLTLEDHPIKPHERRALNFLVNEYLLARSYKLTSITFSDENENQDFEDWNDVGLNIPKPPDLLHIYREFLRATGYDKPPSISIAVQTDFIDTKLEDKEQEMNIMLAEMEKLKSQAISLEQDKCLLQQQIPIEDNAGTQNMNSMATTPEKFEILDSPSQDTSVTTRQPGEADSSSVAVSLGETDPGDRDWTKIQLSRVDGMEGSSTSTSSPTRRLPTRFRKEVMSQCSTSASSPATSMVEEPLKDGVTRDTLVEILAHSLPRVAPNVILNKREELIPLILSGVRLHSDSATREKLLQLLFNLKKRPQEEERRTIVAGLVAMAKLEDAPTEIEEILTLCWEQSQHKYPERRLLAAECCSALAPYTSGAIRNSLVLSMLQQMLLDDKDPEVRARVVRSLALLVALMDDPDKYFQCEELALTALDDASPLVVETASSVLVPVLAQWALSLRRLQSHLLPRVTLKLKNQLRPTHHHSPTKDQMDQERLVASVGVLHYVLPHTVVCVVDVDRVKSRIRGGTATDLTEDFEGICRSDMVNPRVFYEGDVDVAVLLNAFFETSWDEDTWPEKEWLANKHVPDILEMVKSIEASHESIFAELLTYVRSLCLGFGRNVTRTGIHGVFYSEVTELENQLTSLSQDRGVLNLTLVPAYLIVLSTYDLIELSKSLKQFIVGFSLSGVNVLNLQIAVARLCTQERLQEAVLEALWDGVVHKRPSVRCITATLFGGIIARVADRLVTGRVVPAIVTLSTDSDVSVRAAAIPTLGLLVTECTAREARDKARLTLETIAREPQGVPSALAVPLVTTLAAIAPSCPPNYLEDVIATQLTGIAASALQQGRKLDLANSLVEAYSILVYCPLSNQCVTGALLPGLRYLETLVNQVLPQQRDKVRSLLREAESRQDLPKAMERSTSTNSGLSLSLATANVGQGVEDMRQRMSKMFQQKPGTPSVSSIFRKK
ncbi:lisH domain and HEAT repeat-containing protein KIAA1468 homolog isoform X2 [Orussus abietinus]|uniref:lisH domain and HEAT repeat-containing protein KIAA1468 homolog isoform X2 n=1 Tax=Orussus abietinus TaxID=222816 RepID=UPI00062559DC|nr:lisH domain and HEAT repeat-containing protein KIAA1468 homolog isoform X2 [Orussus abietinus]